MLKILSLELGIRFFACSDIFGKAEDSRSQLLDFYPESAFNWVWYLIEKPKMIKLLLKELGS